MPVVGGSILTRGRPHLGSPTHHASLQSLTFLHMSRVLSPLRALTFHQNQFGRHWLRQQFRMKHHLMIGTWYVLESDISRHVNGMVDKPFHVEDDHEMWRFTTKA
jgi:hypothetical protein